MRLQFTIGAVVLILSDMKIAEDTAFYVPLRHPFFLIWTQSNDELSILRDLIEFLLNQLPLVKILILFHQSIYSPHYFSPKHWNLINLMHNTILSFYLLLLHFSSPTIHLGQTDLKSHFPQQHIISHHSSQQHQIYPPHSV